jgi:hypothetical protein
MALDPEAMDAAVLGNLVAKTGRALEDWVAALEAAGPFARPGEAVTWLKSQGMGHVTAQVVVRHWQPAASGPSVETVLGPDGAVLFQSLAAALRAEVPDLRVGVRKGYVTLGTRTQFAVAVPAKRGPGILLGIVAQASGAPLLPPAPPMGGSDRFRFLLQVPEDSAIKKAISHLRAAAGA